MIRPSVFRRYLVISVSITILFLSLGFISFIAAERFEAAHSPSATPFFYAQLVEELGQNDPLRGIRALQRIGQGTMPYDLALYDQNAKLVFATDPRFLSVQLKEKDLPSKAFETRALIPRMNHNPALAIVRLSQKTPTYLLTASRRARPAVPPLIVSIVFVGSSAVLASICCLFLLFFSIRNKARLADLVIKDLQRGNLSARFPVRRLDEFGNAMLRFNSMADEIQRLVERLESSEKARTKLLQELAHDLRTPIASLKSLLETQISRRKDLSEELQIEFGNLSLKEVEYFERLVEDLLFLAQVSEPRYRKDAFEVRIAELLQEESNSLVARHNRTYSKNLRSSLTLIPDLKIPGDPHLLRRMLRNGIDNACSFANSKIDIVMEILGNQLKIVIRNDGAGLTTEKLAAYGTRYGRRSIENTSEGRVSVGLGSVILKAIANLHRGEAHIANITPTGAELTLTLPLKLL